MSQPEGNPILQKYQAWADQTPYVTRVLTISLVLLYVITLFFNAPTYLGNIPYFTLFSFEIYRILTAPFIGNSILSLIIILFMFPQMGGRIESSLGSTQYLFLLIGIGVLTNIVFCLICFFSYLFGMIEAMFWVSSDFWTILFAVFTIECLQVPDMPRQIMFIPINIPSKYMPLVLYLFLCLFSGPILSYLISMGIGYLYINGYLDKLKPNSNFYDQLESNEGLLNPVTRSNGYVLSSAALGSNSWAENLSRPADANIGGYGFSGGFSSNPNDVEAHQEETKQLFPGSGKKLSSAPSSASNSSSSHHTNVTGGTREDVAARRLAALGGGN